DSLPQIPQTQLPAWRNLDPVRISVSLVVLESAIDGLRSKGCMPGAPPHRNHVIVWQLEINIRFAAGVFNQSPIGLRPPVKRRARQRLQQIDREHGNFRSLYELQ